VPRTLGLLARSFFGLNGLLTVWCLGCCGFEPLLNPGDRAMAAQCAEATTMTRSAESAVVVTANAPDGGCDCQSCCAVSSVRFALSAAASEPPALPLTLSAALISIAQEPQYPPPKTSSLLA
jgi:hypothetical protein